MLLRSLFILSGASLLAPVGGPAVAQQVPPWAEGPGDIVLLRQVPHQNAVRPGEPGRPTLINPRTIVAGSVPQALGSGLSRLLTDEEADDVRATRAPQADAEEERFDTLAPDDGTLQTADAPMLGHDRTGLLGSVVSGAVGGSTRQLQDVLSSALGRGK